MVSNWANRAVSYLTAIILCFACFTAESHAATPSAQCDYYDQPSKESEYSKCTIEERGEGKTYRWTLKFEDGRTVIVMEDLDAHGVARSWKINGSPAIGIEINRVHFRGVTIDLQRSVEWSFESDTPEKATTESKSKDLEYDPRTALQAQQFNQVVLETTGCLRDAIKTALQLGRRNRNDILSWATRMCGIKFFYVYKIIGRPQEEGRAYLIALAESQLNEILKYGQ